MPSKPMLGKTILKPGKVYYAGATLFYVGKDGKRKETGKMSVPKNKIITVKEYQKLFGNKKDKKP